MFSPIASAKASAHNGILLVACNAECPDLQQLLSLAFLLSQELWGVIAAKIGYFHFEGVISNMVVDFMWGRIPVQNFLLKYIVTKYIIAKNLFIIAKI